MIYLLSFQQSSRGVSMWWSQEHNETFNQVKRFVSCIDQWTPVMKTRVQSFGNLSTEHLVRRKLWCWHNMKKHLKVFVIEFMDLVSCRQRLDLFNSRFEFITYITKRILTYDLRGTCTSLLAPMKIIGTWSMSSSRVDRTNCSWATP